uniref:Uncharacterized protein n=1 Tax=Arundo donax TaxID=35708 RepID=A0A0A9B4J4_ARUDO
MLKILGDECDACWHCSLKFVIFVMQLDYLFVLTRNFWEMQALVVLRAMLEYKLQYLLPLLSYLLFSFESDLLK